MSTVVSLRDKQRHCIKCMVNLNGPVGKNLTAEPVWKLLIYDKMGQDIISPLLSVKELRELGVTLHLPLDTERDAIPEVPVIYFVMPTEENISRICQDFRNQLYDHYYLNFITPIPRQKLDDLASAALQSNVAASICKVFDQFSYFISLEDEMFTLRESDKETISYYAINRGDVTEAEMDAIMNSIVEGLFSVFVTLGVVPVIRCPKGNAAEVVAKGLDKKLRENLMDTRNNLFVGSSNFQQPELMPRIRPLLVILDRNMDMATPLHHTWTYQAMAHDVLDLRLNQVKIRDPDADSESGGTRPKRPLLKTFDLKSSDKFWQQQRGCPFPQVAEAVQEELESYRSAEDDVKRLKAAMGLDGNEEASPLLTDTTAKLNSAVSSLPELLERKKCIDMHTTIATAILDQIKQRKLDIYFETEEKILSKSLADRSPLDLILEPEAGCPEDKMRLFLIHLLLSDLTPNSQEETKKYEAALLDAGCDMRPLNYMKRWKTFSNHMPVTSGASYGGGTKTVSMFSKLVSQGSQFVMEGVKNLVVKKHVLPLTRMVDCLMDSRTPQDMQEFLYFDPKLKKPDKASQVNQVSYTDAVVFVVGGGNYIEYQNLMDHCKTKGQKSICRRIIYGCTDLMNANQFLSQLSNLA